MHRTICLLVCLFPAATAAEIEESITYDKPTRYHEVPMLWPRVEAGELPPIEERVSDDPLVVGPGDAYGMTSIGRYGGRLHFDAMDASSVQGATDMTVAFFHDTPGNFHPLVFKGYEVSDDKRVWTIHMRRGMKWSDGHPFTADDVVFWYEG